MGRLRAPSPKVPTYGDREREALNRNIPRENEYINIINEPAADENAVGNLQPNEPNEPNLPIVNENPIRNIDNGAVQPNNGNQEASGVLGIIARNESLIGNRPSGLFSMVSRNSHESHLRNVSQLNNQNQQPLGLFDIIGNEVSVRRPSSLFSRIGRDNIAGENHLRIEPQNFQPRQYIYNSSGQHHLGLDQHRIEIGSGSQRPYYNIFNSDGPSVWDRYRFGLRFSRIFNMPSESPRRIGLQRSSTVNDILSLNNASSESSNNELGQSSVILNRISNHDNSIVNNQRTDEQGSSLLSDIFDRYYGPALSRRRAGLPGPEIDDVLGIYDSFIDNPQTARSSLNRNTLDANAASPSRIGSRSSRIYGTFGVNDNSVESSPRVGSRAAQIYGSIGVNDNSPGNRASQIRNLLNDNSAETSQRSQSRSRIYNSFGVNDNSAESSPRVGSRASQIRNLLYDDSAESSPRVGSRVSQIRNLLNVDSAESSPRVGSRVSQIRNLLNDDTAESSPGVGSRVSQIRNLLNVDSAESSPGVGSRVSQIRNLLNVDTAESSPGVGSRVSQIRNLLNVDTAESSPGVGSRVSQIRNLLNVDTAESSPRVGSRVSQIRNLLNVDTAESSPGVGSRIYNSFGVNDNSAESSPRVGSRVSQIRNLLNVDSAESSPGVGSRVSQIRNLLNVDSAESSPGVGSRVSQIRNLLNVDSAESSPGVGSRASQIRNLLYEDSPESPQRNQSRSRIYDSFGVNDNSAESYAQMESRSSRIYDWLNDNSAESPQRSRSRSRVSDMRYRPYSSSYLSTVPSVLLRLITLHERLKSEREREEAANEESRRLEELQDQSEETLRMNQSSNTIFGHQMSSLLSTLPSELSNECKRKILQTILLYRAKARRMRPDSE